MEGKHAKFEQAIREACDAEDHDRATTVLIEKYGPEIMGFLVARMRDHTAASDVFAIFCEDVWKGMPKFQWRSSARVWAYTLARNASVRFAKQAYRKPERNVGLSQTSAVAKMAEEVRASTLAYLKTTVKTRMRELREQLDDEEQTLLILRVDKKLAWNELAEVMGQEEGNEGDKPDPDALKKEAARLRKRFQLAKNKLRKLAEAEGLIGSDNA